MALFDREMVNTLRVARLVPFDLAPVLPQSAQETDEVVVLVHGFLASAGAFRPMKSRIERETQAAVATFSHAPGVGVQRIAESLAALVSELPRTARVHLVGHSLGGVVARWYVQELFGHVRVAQTISIASPFFGSPIANRFPYLVGDDLHRESALLARLRARAHVGDVPHTSIVGSDDLWVGPAEHGIFAHGESVVLHGRGHNSLLFDEEATQHVVTRLLRKSMLRGGTAAW